MPSLQIQTLLAELRDLYAKVIKRVLSDRDTVFHAANVSAATDSVSPALDRHLESIVVTSRGNEGSDSLPVLTDNEKSKRQVTSLKRIGNGLSDYFKRSRPTLRLRPRISADLERETWRRIHMAMRYAGEGDLEKAQLQGQIAMEAMKELSRYIPEEEYELFRDKVLQELDAMQNAVVESVTGNHGSQSSEQHGEH